MSAAPEATVDEARGYAVEGGSQSEVIDQHPDESTSSRRSAAGRAHPRTTTAPWVLSRVDHGVSIGGRNPSVHADTCRCQCETCLETFCSRDAPVSDRWRRSTDKLSRSRRDCQLGLARLPSACVELSCSNWLPDRDRQHRSTPNACRASLRRPEELRDVAAARRIGGSANS